MLKTQQYLRCLTIKLMTIFEHNSFFVDILFIPILALTFRPYGHLLSLVLRIEKSLFKLFNFCMNYSEVNTQKTCLFD